jgi:large conductance mechanosensitive channel
MENDMSLLKEFKSFAMRGNVVDMAVGIIIGASFGKIVSSLVNDVLMPPIGALIGGMDFSSLSVHLISATVDHPAVVVKYGIFINMIIDFVIVAFAMFMIIQGMNRLTKKQEVAAVVATTKECPECLMTIPVKAMRCGHCSAVLK